MGGCGPVLKVFRGESGPSLYPLGRGHVRGLENPPSHPSGRYMFEGVSHLGGRMLVCGRFRLLHISLWMRSFHPHYSHILIVASLRLRFGVRQLVGHTHTHTHTQTEIIENPAPPNAFFLLYTHFRFFYIHVIVLSSFFQN